jgi:hypothetical protein
MSLPIIKFDDAGKISNLDEIFVDIPYGVVDKVGDSGRSVIAWLNQEDKVINGIDNHCFIWGRVLVGEGKSRQKNLSGTFRTYRIHSTSDAIKEAIVKNCAFGAV